LIKENGLHDLSAAVHVPYALAALTGCL